VTTAANVASLAEQGGTWVPTEFVEPGTFSSLVTPLENAIGSVIEPGGTITVATIDNMAQQVHGSYIRRLERSIECLQDQNKTLWNALDAVAAILRGVDSENRLPSWVNASIFVALIDEVLAVPYRKDDESTGT
jgi:hypothetical protein